MALSFVIKRQANIVQAQFDINAENDDGYVRVSSGGYNSTATSLYASTDYQPWLRYSNCTIPPGATIQSAYLRIVAYTDYATPTNSTVFGFDEDDASVPATENDYTARPKATAQVTYEMPIFTASGMVFNSGDIKTVIQEIIDRPGWLAGNALMLGFTCVAQRRVSAYPHLTNDSVQLHVSYSV